MKAVVLSPFKKAASAFINCNSATVIKGNFESFLKNVRDKLSLIATAGAVFTGCPKKLSVLLLAGKAVDSPKLSVIPLNVLSGLGINKNAILGSRTPV